MQIETLIYELLAAKQAESDAKDNRMEAERMLAEAIGNDSVEGAKSIETSGFRVTVVNKLNRKLDYDEYLKIEDSLPENLRFVIMKPDIDLKVLRHLEAVDPKVVALCVTTKPAKTAVEVKEI